MKLYGSEKPPLYPIERLTGFDIWLVCGKGDRLATPRDYHNLRKILEEQNCLGNFYENDLGHIALVNPIKGRDDHLKWLLENL